MKPEQDKQFVIFERYLDVLLYAAHASGSFAMRDIRECVLDSSRATAYLCLCNLVKSGYLAKETTTRYTATAKTKELFGSAT
ncbi:hypothetical protein [Acinetobacter lactucae]|uniref:Uncharacterized protein n=1 Tax=Acinetobacter lactucae TaxID=1785128 RepID=R8YWP1_9GAMM|nr:hypothetical protein [Acinetobacter lactucae]EOQ73506.1 hypothetical protein F929_03449 [Acinetobacter lactucae]